VVGVLEQVSEVGLADGRERDAEEVDLAVLDALEQQRERPGELRALDVDLGRLREAEGPDLLFLGKVGVLLGDGDDYGRAVAAIRCGGL
jgi:hypothetical protein